MNVEELHLSLRAYNCLKRAGINTVEQLSGMTESDLSRIRGMGAVSVAEIEEKMLSLRLPEIDSEKAKDVELHSCPFCGGVIAGIDSKRKGMEIHTKATCSRCWMEFSYIQDFAYSNTRGRVAPLNPSFEEVWNRRVGDGK